MTMGKVFIFMIAASEFVLGERMVTKLCNFDKTFGGGYYHSDLNNSCTCYSNSLPPWGLPGIEITCRYQDFENEFSKAEILPQGTVSFDGSYNLFKFVPDFVCDTLKYLDMSHNIISSLDDKNFQKISNLERINLSHNKIEMIPTDAFTGLHRILWIDLDGNFIKKIQTNAFAGLSYLQYLKLSYNPLNEVFTHNHSDLFADYGVTPKLKELTMNNCSLEEIDLVNGVGLEAIYLRSNNLMTLQRLPRAVKMLDISANPIRVLSAKFLPHLFSLESLWMEDMPDLHKIDEYSLYGLPRLNNLNLRGSKNLSIIHPHAFGRNVVQNETDTVLEVISLEGTNLRTLNSSLSFAFETLGDMELQGNPLHCDCNLIWIHKMKIETNGQCISPPELKGKLLSSVDEKDLLCEEPTSWVYKMFNVFLIVLLIVLGIVAIILIIKGVRPKKVQFRKVGETSPYARVTIEPNLAENQFTI